MTAPRSPPLLPLPSPLLTTTNEPAWRACQHGGCHGGLRCVRGVWAESFGEILLLYATALIFFTWALRPRRSCAQEALPTVRERLLLRPEGAEKAHSKEKGQVTKARHSTSASSNGQDRSQALSLAAVPLPTIALGPDRKRHTTALPALAVPLPRPQRMRRHRSPTRESGEPEQSHPVRVPSLENTRAGWLCRHAGAREDPDGARGESAWTRSPKHYAHGTLGLQTPGSKRASLSGAAMPPQAEASDGDRTLATVREGSPGIERGLVLRISTRTNSCEQCSFISLAISTSPELSPPGCLITPLDSSAAATSKIIDPPRASSHRSTAPEKTPASKRASSGRAEASGGDRALARARKSSLEIERAPLARAASGSSVARHQVSASRDAVASKKVGKFERGEGMPKGASDLSGWQSATILLESKRDLLESKRDLSGWQSATRFYSNIVQKRSRPAGSDNSKKVAVRPAPGHSSSV